MVQLIIVVIALMLSAATVMASISYIPANRATERAVEARAKSGFSDLRAGWLDHRARHGIELAVAAGLGELTPRYVFVPPAPAPGMSWSYGGDPAVGYWFCASGQLNAMAYEGLVRNAMHFSPQAYFLSNQCGMLTSTGTPQTFPAAVAATLWVVRF